MVELFANRGDPDQTPRSVASDLGLHYLPVTSVGVSSLQWINYTNWVINKILAVYQNQVRKLKTK